MRITVLDDDPGRKINLNRERYTVYLDGEEVHKCLTTDDEKGEIIEIVTDDKGMMLADDGEIRRCTRYGVVRIELCPR